MNPISPKVANGAAAAGTASPLAIILIWGLGHWMTIPPEIAAAMASIISGAAGFVGGYLTKLEAQTAPQTTTGGTP
jgi:hypothetical protein